MDSTLHIDWIEIDLIGKNGRLETGNFKNMKQSLLREIFYRKVGENNMTKNNQHVVTHNGDWAVRGERNRKVTSVHYTQGDAINAARDIAINQKSEVVIHGRDGKIRDKDSYGNDPFPPRG